MPRSVALTTAQARARGVTERVLRGPRYRRIFHGVYLPADVPPTVVRRAEAALTIAPRGAVVARHTAATIWGGAVPDTSETHLVLPRGARLRVQGVDARVGRRVELSVVEGLRMTTPTQTFLDLGGDLDLVELVVLGDSLVGRRRATPQELVTAAAAYRGPHAARLRRAAASVRAGVESPMESRLRMLLVLAGLPEPVVQHPIRDPTGRVRYRLDLAYPTWRVAIEYDGRHHAEDGAQWRWDVQRREELDADAWRLVVVLSADLYGTPSHTLDRVVAAVAAQGAAIRLRSGEWRRYFPGRD